MEKYIILLMKVQKKKNINYQEGAWLLSDKEYRGDKSAGGVDLSESPIKLSLIDPYANPYTANTSTIISS